jgi:hypothetical protein
MTAVLGVDRNGSRVDIGDRVRVLDIRRSILERLTGAELMTVSSILGQVAEVFDVYDDGQVWVSISWPRPDGDTELHAIAVDSHAIELVTEE